MATQRVCIGCGLTKDDLGNLKFNTGDPTWPHTSCSPVSGSNVYCADNVLYGEPEKFFVNVQGAITQSTSNDIELNTLAPVGGGLTAFGPSIKGSYTNPSKCRDMGIDIYSGIEHVRFQSNQAAPGTTQFFMQPRVKLTGGIVDTFVGGHAAYGYGAVGTVFNIDIQGCLTRRTYILPAGATVTFELQTEIRVDTYVSSGIIQNPITVLRIEGMSF